MRCLSKLNKNRVLKYVLAFVVVIIALKFLIYLNNNRASDSLKVSDNFKKAIESTVKNPKKNRIMLDNVDVTEKYIEQIKNLYDKEDYEGIYKLLEMDKHTGLQLTIDD